MKLEDLRPLYRHMSWADAAVWRAIHAAPRVAEDSKLHELLYHIHLVQRAFLLLWTSKPLEFPEASSFEDLTAISRWGYRYHGQVSAHLDGVEATALGEILELPWSEQIAGRLGQTPQPSTLGETMLQVPLHSTHHRGQVLARLRELGEEPPLVDFIAWVWAGKPEAEWPESAVA